MAICVMRRIKPMVALTFLKKFQSQLLLEDCESPTYESILPSTVEIVPFHMIN